MSNIPEIRGKRKDNGRWIKARSIITLKNESGELDYYIGDSTETFYTAEDGKGNIVRAQGSFIKVDPDTVGLCSEMTDKNLQMIFDGDILSTGKETVLCRMTRKRCELLRKNGRTMTWEMRHKAEIIGNIWDNPELLEGLI